MFETLFNDFYYEEYDETNYKTKINLLSIHHFFKLNPLEHKSKLKGFNFSITRFSNFPQFIKINSIKIK